MSRFKRGGGVNPLSFILPWLPFLLIIGAVIWLLSSGALGGLSKALKSLFDSIGDSFSGAKDWFQYGGSGQASNIKGQIDQINKAAQEKGLKVTPITQSKSIKLHDAMNAYHPFSLSSMLTQDEAIIARDILIQNTLEDQARIILAYGEQSLPSRLLLWNVLWDDTSGTLRDHVQRFIPEGEAKNVMLHYIDYAIRTYLTS